MLVILITYNCRQNVCGCYFWWVPGHELYVYLGHLTLNYNDQHILILGNYLYLIIIKNNVSYTIKYIIK